MKIWQTVIVISGHRPIEERAYFGHSEEQARAIQAWLDRNGVTSTVMDKETFDNGGSLYVKQKYERRNL